MIQRIIYIKRYSIRQHNANMKKENEDANNKFLSLAIFNRLNSTSSTNFSNIYDAFYKTIHVRGIQVQNF